MRIPYIVFGWCSKMVFCKYPTSLAVYCCLWLVLSLLSQGDRCCQHGWERKIKKIKHGHSESSGSRSSNLQAATKDKRRKERACVLLHSGGFSFLSNTLYCFENPPPPLRRKRRRMKETWTSIWNAHLLHPALKILPRLSIQNQAYSVLRNIRK